MAPVRRGEMLGSVVATNWKKRNINIFALYDFEKDKEYRQID